MFRIEIPIIDIPQWSTHRLLLTLLFTVQRTVSAFEQLDLHGQPPTINRSDGPAL